MRRGTYYLMLDNGTVDKIIRTYTNFANALKAMVRMNRKHKTNAYWVSVGDRQEGGK